MRFKLYFASADGDYSQKVTSILNYTTITNAVVSLNVSSSHVTDARHSSNDGTAKYIFGDAVMVWRAWVLCETYKNLKFALFVPGFFLVLTCRQYLPLRLLLFTSFTDRQSPFAVCVFSTIVIRIIIFYVTAGSLSGTAAPHPLVNAINISQVGVIIGSLGTSVTTTSMISYLLWYVRIYLAIHS